MHKKARNPIWWDKFFEYFYPKVYFGFLNKLIETNPRFRNFVKNLPSKCPFERQYWLWDKYLILYIPALCKFNPTFSQLMELKVKIINEEG